MGFGGAPFLLRQWCLRYSARSNAVLSLLLSAPIAYAFLGYFVSVPFKLAFMTAQVGQPLEGTMRDIRGDLQERAILVDEQIRAAVAHFDKAIQQLQTERDARINDLKASLRNACQTHGI